MKKYCQIPVKSKGKKALITLCNAFALKEMEDLLLLLLLLCLKPQRHECQI